MSDQLCDLRKQWEQGETIFYDELEHQGFDISIVQIESVGRSFYQVFRYFTVGEQWQVSCDGEFTVERDAWLKVMGLLT